MLKNFFRHSTVRGFTDLRELSAFKYLNNIWIPSELIPFFLPRRQVTTDETKAGLVDRYAHRDTPLKKYTPIHKNCFLKFKICLVRGIFSLGENIFYLFSTPSIPNKESVFDTAYFFLNVYWCQHNHWVWTKHVFCHELRCIDHAPKRKPNS